jgi:tetratricopeptide (TPR) repeat protein
VLITHRFYRRTLAVAPKEFSALYNYAMLLTDVRGNHDAVRPCVPVFVSSLIAGQAEKMFERAIAAAPRDPDVLMRFAFFLEATRHKPDEAEGFYRQAAEVVPSAKTYYELAYFLQNTRKEYDAGT